MRKAYFTLFALGLFGCRPPEIGGADAEVAFSVPALGFEATYLGAERTLTVAVENHGRAGVDVALEVDGPFALGEEAIHVGGGSSVAIPVTFRPQSVGDANGTLRLVGMEEISPVALSGVGLAPGRCIPSSSCVTTAFDVDRGECVETPVTDGTACAGETLCVTAGQCFSGVCKGLPVSCDDGNACTHDVCVMGEGCVHFDGSAECAAPADRCHAAACDPMVGCHVVEVADGTSCGRRGCDTADICLAGACKSVTVPDGTACGEASPCQGRGVCRSKACELPAAMPLTEAWSYTPPQPFRVFFHGVADPAGNLYAIECLEGGVYAHDECFSLSFNSQGALRFRQPVALQDDWKGADGLQLLVGDVFVFAVGEKELFAVSTVDGHLLWQKSLVDFLGGVNPLTDLSAPVQEIRALAAGGNNRVWIVVNYAGATSGTMAAGAPVQNFAELIILDAASGQLRWSYRAAEEVFYGVVLDGSNTAYVGATGPDPGPISLRVFTAGGMVWPPVQVPALPRAVFNGMLVLANGQTVATWDATKTVWPGLALSTLRNGHELSTVASFPGAFGFLGDANQVWLVSRLGALGTPTTGVPIYAPLPLPASWPVGIQYVSREPVTTPSLTDKGVAVVSGALLPSDHWLRGVGADGAQVFACKLPPSLGGVSKFFGTAALTDERWATMEEVFSNNSLVPIPDRLRVFAAPGLKPAQYGWTAQFGSLARDNREHRAGITPHE